jgi:class 3 adenylate cyclase
VIEIAVECAIGIALVGLIVRLATSRRRWMRRHPTPTFVFADLAGYTALTEEHGDEAAAQVAREFRRTMCALSREHGAWQVKSMGDGVMIWTPDAGRRTPDAGRRTPDAGRRTPDAGRRTPGRRSRSRRTPSRTSGRARICSRCASACTPGPR